MEVKIKPYNEMSNFGIWQRRMQGLLVQSRMQISLLGIEKKLQDTTNAWEVGIEATFLLHMINSGSKYEPTIPIPIRIS